MRLFSRYVVGEIVPPFLLGFAAYTFILLIRTIFQMTDFVVRRSATLGEVGWLVALSIPWIVVLTIPMAFLLGILIGIGAALILRAVPDCPACFAPTFLLQRKWLRRILPWLEWRFCPQCGWHGPSKLQPQRRVAAPRMRARPAVHPWEEPGGPHF